jgi:hypothetical protein
MTVPRPLGFVLPYFYGDRTFTDSGSFLCYKLSFEGSPEPNQKMQAVRLSNREKL